MSDARKITVLRDFSYSERVGEEELAIERFLQSAPDWASISVQPPEFIQQRESVANADVVISFGLKQYPDQTFEWLLEHPCHIHIVQDWWEPIQPQSKWRNQIVENARAVVFSSPLHAERYQRLYAIERAFYCIPFPMLESDWAEQDREFTQEDAVLWCAPWHPDYGSDLMLRWADTEQVLVHAHGLEVPKGEIAPLVEGRGPIALDVAAPSFLPYSRFVFFPRTPVPFGFTTLLAYALGLEIIYSNEIGCMSYGNMDSLIESCAHATEDFWQVVEGAVAA